MEPSSSEVIKIVIALAAMALGLIVMTAGIIGSAILRRKSANQVNENLPDFLKSRFSDVTLDGEKGAATFFHERRLWKVISDFFQPMGHNRYGQEVPLPDQYKIPRTILSVKIYDPAPDGQAEDWLNFRLKQSFTSTIGPDGKREPIAVLWADTKDPELKRLLESDEGLIRLVCPSDADSIMTHYQNDVVELKNGRLTIVRHVQLTTTAKAEKFFNMATGIFQKIRDLAEEQMGRGRFSQLESVLDGSQGGAMWDDWIYDEIDPDSPSTDSPADDPEVMAPERGIDGADSIAGYLDGASDSQAPVIPSSRRSESSLSRRG